jgi:uncharacterized protein (DUF302 family)
MNRGLLLAALLCWAAAASAEPPASPVESSTVTIVRGMTDKTFDDVVFELDFAITERNFRITGRNTIGKGLRARGYADFPDFEVIHFCNLENAREVLLVDPGFIAQMPCRITVHREAGRTVVSIVLLPEDHADPRVNAFAVRINEQMREILDFVLEQD